MLSSKRHKPKSAVVGLRAVQALSSLVVPGTLDNVPEEEELKLGASNDAQGFRTEDWKSVQEIVKKMFIEEKIAESWEMISVLHQKIENILRSKTGTFLQDYYKQELLSREMSIIGDHLKKFEGVELLRHLETTWTLFFTRTLPSLEALLHSVKPKGRMSVRTITLAAFRDIVVLSDCVEDALNGYLEKYKTPEISHMFMILQSVHDSRPPSKQQLRMEVWAARVAGLLMGVQGLYAGGRLVVAGPAGDVNEYRRVSRMFNVQKLQLDTLNQVFSKAIRSKRES